MQIDKTISYIAENLYEIHNGDFSDSIIVIPDYTIYTNISKHLSSLSQKTLWAPTPFTPCALARDIASTQEITDVDATHLLYKVWKDLCCENKSFEEFYFLGRKILQDFDYLAKFCIDIESIIDRDNYQRDQFFPRDYFINCHKDYTQLLNNRRLSYQAICYNQAITTLLNTTPQSLHKKTISILGIEHPYPIQASFITSLSHKCKVYLYYRPYLDQKRYISQTSHYTRTFQNLDFKSDTINLIEVKSKHICKSIEILECQTRPVQATTIGYKVEQLLTAPVPNTPYTDHKVAIVIEKSDLLFTLIASLPCDISHLNIDVSYQICNTNTYALVLRLINYFIQQTKSQNRNLANVDTAEEILKCPIFAADKEIKSILTEKFKTDNHSLSIHDTFAHHQKTIKIFLIPETVGLIEYLLGTTQIMLTYAKNLPDSYLEVATIQTIESKLKRLNSYIINSIKINNCAKIILNTLQNMSIKIQKNSSLNSNFYICSLDKINYSHYDHIYIIDCNEGVYPKKIKKTTFIKSDPNTHPPSTVDNNRSLHDTIFTALPYHTERLSLLYSSSEADTSRYAMKFLHMYPDISSKSTISKPLKAHTPNEIIIHKDDKIVTELQKFNLLAHQDFTPLTPSSINTYIDCSLKFYFKYIKKLATKPIRQPLATDAMFGKIFHKVMQKAYEPYLNPEQNSIITHSTIDEILNNLEEIVQQIFDNKFCKNLSPIDTNHNGYNALAIEIAKRCAQKILTLDSSHAPFEIVGLEYGPLQGFYTDINLNQELKIRLQGIIDRIDSKHGEYRVVDYKTGPYTNKFKDIASLFDRSNPSRAASTLQIILYSWILSTHKVFHNTTISPHIINIRQLFVKNPCHNIYIKDNKSYHPIEDIALHSYDIKKKLEDTLKELFDTDTPFSQTNNKNTCLSCQYSKICSRFKG